MHRTRGQVRKHPDILNCLLSFLFGKKNRKRRFGYAVCGRLMMFLKSRQPMDQVRNEETRPHSVLAHMVEACDLS